MQALPMNIYFLRINATFADFVSSPPFYTFAMFSSLVHLRTQAHTPLGGEDMTWINGGVCLFAEKLHEPITHKEEASLPNQSASFEM